MNARKVFLIAGVLFLLLVLPVGAGTNSNTQYDCAQAPLTGWTDGKFQTHPRASLGGERVLFDIDLGHLGPDVDVIAGIDFPEVIDAGFQRIYDPSGAIETRVVFVLRTDIEYLQLKEALGGDEFHVYQIANKGGDEELARQLYCHAVNTARKHQRVYLVGDWGSFLQQYGAGERSFLDRVVLCQVPAMPSLGIQPCDFVTGP